VLLFERDRRGAFRPAARWSRRALATATTHDLPTLAAWWQGNDLALQRELGLLGARELARAQQDRAAERHALARRLRLRSDAPYADLCRSAHAFLAATPCPLVGVSLDDLAGELEPANVPGVSPDRYPSWTRRMRRTPAQVFADPLARAMLSELRARRGRSRSRS
jgi:4-alpha-glucanotransferase